MTSILAPRSPASCRELFLAFTWLALQGFGGVLAVAQRELVERHRWLTRAEFMELFAAAQVLPGPNIVNLALMIGDRFFSWRGAFSALAGIIALPLVIVLIATALYAQYAQHPMVSNALRGMGAVSAGLIIATAIKLMGTLKANPLGLGPCLAIGGIALVLIAVLHLPLWWLIFGLGSLAVGAAWWKLGP